MTRRIILLLAATLLSSCSVLPERGESPRSGQARSQPPPVAVAPRERQCLATLAGVGAQFSPLPDRYISEGCTNLGTVQLNALRSDDANFAVSNLGPVTCPVSQAFAAWARFGVDRAARQILGSPVERIETYGSYSCRNVAGTGRRSAHSTASAIDVSGFVLEDGRRIMVKEDWDGGSRLEREFLRVVHDSACKRFSTVLGPEYNAAHRDHFHLEGVIDQRSYCR